MLGKTVKSDLERAQSRALAKRPEVEIAFVLDRSSSMSEHVAEAVGGFNKFLKDQQGVDGQASVTFVTFHDDVEVKFQGVLIDDVKPLSSRDYSPAGCTALCDGVGITLQNAMTRHMQRPSEKPLRSLMVIITDGEENASKKYKRDTLAGMVQRARAVFGWEFVLIGVGMADVKHIAVDLGMDENLALPLKGGAKGVLDAYKVAMEAAKQFREEGVITRLLPPKS